MRLVRVESYILLIQRWWVDQLLSTLPAMLSLSLLKRTAEKIR